MWMDLSCPKIEDAGLNIQNPWVRIQVRRKHRNALFGPGKSDHGTNVAEHVMDMAPTFLELANASYPEMRNGEPLAPQRGKSMVSLLSKKSQQLRAPDEAIGWEFNNWRAIRLGDHKATWISSPYGPGEWQVFDLATDPGESKDLASEEPALRQRLTDAWQEYAGDVGVVPPEIEAVVGR